MHLVLNAIFLVMGLKWGDWKNWRKYHATILFLWFGDLLYNVFVINTSCGSIRKVSLPRHF